MNDENQNLSNTFSFILKNPQFVITIIFSVFPEEIATFYATIYCDFLKIVSRINDDNIRNKK